MRYKNPLITELFVELHLKAGTFDADKILALAHQLRNDQFQVIEFTNSQRIVSNEVTFEPRIRCWTSDKKRLIQLSTDLLIVNCVGKYLGWDDFRSHFEKCVEWFESSTGSLDINTVSLNVIDRTEAIERNGFRLGDYLICGGGNFVPPAYGEISSAADISLGLGLINVDGYNRVIKIAVRPSDKNVLLQIHTVIHRALQISLPLSKLVEKLHDEANECFEQLITKKTRDEVMGGEVPE